jgi:hypothetical protein
MTKAEAKALSLEVWGYLAEHPECERKKDMPDAIYNKVKDFKNSCPLCELFYYRGCKGCVLYESGEKCSNISSLYSSWCYPFIGEVDNEKSKAAAKGIYEIIQEWETGEDE